MTNSTLGLRIACIGEAMVELTLRREDDAPVGVGFAGDTLNSAIYLKRLLGDSSTVAFTTVLGNDPLSERMIRYIQSEGINTETVNRSTDRQVGLYAISTDQSGERTFSYWRSESAARTLFQINQTLDFSDLSGFNVIMLSAISLAILPDNVRQAFLATLAELRSTQGVTIVFDSNFRPKLWESIDNARATVADAWRITDIALPSIDDEMALFGDDGERSVLARLRGYGIKSGALKRGALGARSIGSDALTVASGMKDEEPVAISVVDTTAAGDSFNAGYLSALLTGSQEQEALIAGHECALRVIAHPGAIIPKTQW